MSIKITSRFSPSIVRAAQIAEAMLALARVSDNSPLHKMASDSFSNMIGIIVHGRPSLLPSSICPNPPGSMMMLPA